jgi:hypothetical protein
MPDLQSSRLIIAKGLMFFGIAALSAFLLIIEMPSLRVAILLGLLVWASCRFYYFLFYVLERYVDSTLSYAGLWALASAISRRCVARDRDRDQAK